MRRHSRGQADQGEILDDCCHMISASRTPRIIRSKDHVIIKSKRSTNLLIEYLMPPLTKSFQLLASKLKLREKPKKRPYVENETEYNNSEEIKILDENFTIGQLKMRAKDPHNLPLARRPRTNLDGTSNKSFRRVSKVCARAC